MRLLQKYSGHCPQFTSKTKLFRTPSSWGEESWSLSGAWVRLALRHVPPSKPKVPQRAQKHPNYPGLPSGFPKVPPIVENPGLPSPEKPLLTDQNVYNFELLTVQFIGTENPSVIYPWMSIYQRVKVFWIVCTYPPSSALVGNAWFHTFSHLSWGWWWHSQTV